MRMLLTLLGIAALVIVALMQFGAVSVDQTRTGSIQTPKFEAKVARVSIGTDTKSVDVPTIDVEKPQPTR